MNPQDNCKLEGNKPQWNPYLLVQTAHVNLREISSITVEMPKRNKKISEWMTNEKKTIAWFKNERK